MGEELAVGHPILHVDAVAAQHGPRTGVFVHHRPLRGRHVVVVRRLSRLLLLLDRAIREHDRRTGSDRSQRAHELLIGELEEGRTYVQPLLLRLPQQRQQSFAQLAGEQVAPLGIVEVHDHVVEGLRAVLQFEVLAKHPLHPLRSDDATVEIAGKGRTDVWIESNGARPGAGFGRQLGHPVPVIADHRHDAVADGIAGAREIVGPHVLLNRPDGRWPMLAAGPLLVLEPGVAVERFILAVPPPIDGEAAALGNLFRRFPCEQDVIAVVTHVQRDRHECLPVATRVTRPEQESDVRVELPGDDDARRGAGSRFRRRCGRASCDRST